MAWQSLSALDTLLYMSIYGDKNPLVLCGFVKCSLETVIQASIPSPLIYNAERNPVFFVSWELGKDNGAGCHKVKCYCKGLSLDACLQR